MKLMIGLPVGGRRIDYGIFFALNKCGVTGYELRVATGGTACYHFNVLLACAVEAGCDRFLLWHQDVMPNEAGWLAKLSEIMEARKLAALSVELPIKNEDGQTSTAVMEQLSDGRMKMINISRDVAHSFPDTFALDDVRLAFPAATALLVNNGLLLLDLTQADPRKGFYFQSEDILRAGEDGKLQADFVPEDWHYSLQLAKAGLPYAATTAIRCLHYGEKGWEN